MLPHLLVGLAVTVAGTAPPTPDTVPLYEDLGDHHHAVTATARAQDYFDQGLRLHYGFNHAEAIRSFARGAELDPGCAMCWWGVALSAGPNINAAMDSASGARAHRAVTRAQELAARVSEKERVFIEALARRYDPDPTAPRPPLDSAYARAMGGVADRYRTDDDAHALYGAALMMLSPWDYWLDDRTLRPSGERALEHLERVVARNQDHAGACHFYIHLVESAHPRWAEDCAERLPDLMPGAGHVVHMPAHVYIRVGRYADAVETNLHAAHADEEHVEDMAPDGVYMLGYYPHNYHFIWFAGSMAGMSAEAIAAARQTAEEVNRDLMRAPGLAALQHYLVTPLFALVRFGRWDEVLEEPAPPADLSYPTGIRHYARALAFTARDEPDRALEELSGLRGAMEDRSLEEMLIWEINPASAILAIAEKVVEGEMAAAAGDHDGAIRALRSGV
ncbi:MAG TPA: hypothetical protein VLL48_12455, partial [Longimicrobiales bacterium]|nr:hypothetical protein [Longimicrobiales bacterium]